MKLINFSLAIKGKILLSNVDVNFQRGKINHILGKNGTGKTCFAKAIVGAINYDGEIVYDKSSVCVIGSYTNLPLDFKVKDIIKMVEKKNEYQMVKTLYDQLDIVDIPNELKIKSLSDGQRQKLKLLFFLSTKPKIIILDEFTNALDKKSCLEIYKFLNSYIKVNYITVLNITHNLTDIEYLDGVYYLLGNHSINAISSKDKAIDCYIRG